jgi:hypothetical protein
MFVDPAISRAKLERELSEYLAQSDVYRQRGIWLLEYKFPQVLFALVAANAKPSLLVPFGVLLDFSNYDVEPPSVQLVNPLTKARLKRSEVQYPFPRQRPNGQVEELLQAFEDEKPFICLQGVREYHKNPAHTGDSWFLHRGTGVGKLIYLLDTLSRYGTEPIRSQSGQIQILLNGFAVTQPPP